MACLFPKNENDEVKKGWLEQRTNIRKYNARWNEFLDELEEATLGARPQGDYYRYEDYKKRFTSLFVLSVRRIVKIVQISILLYIDHAPLPVPRVLP